jgi:hypothetical protein
MSGVDAGKFAALESVLGRIIAKRFNHDEIEDLLAGVDRSIKGGDYEISSPGYCAEFTRGFEEVIRYLRQCGEGKT